MCQCQRLGARLAALKKPMVAVHRGMQTADHAVLSTIKDLVIEAQRFMERCVCNTHVFISCYIRDCM